MGCPFKSDLVHVLRFFGDASETTLPHHQALGRRFVSSRFRV